MPQCPVCNKQYKTTHNSSKCTVILLERQLKNKDSLIQNYKKNIELLYLQNNIFSSIIKQKLGITLDDITKITNNGIHLEDLYQTTD